MFFLDGDCWPLAARPPSMAAYMRGSKQGVGSYGGEFQAPFACVFYKQSVTGRNCKCPFTGTCQNCLWTAQDGGGANHTKTICTRCKGGFNLIAEADRPAGVAGPQSAECVPASAGCPPGLTHYRPQGSYGWACVKPFTCARGDVQVADAPCACSGDNVASCEWRVDNVDSASVAVACVQGFQLETGECV